MQIESSKKNKIIAVILAIIMLFMGILCGYMLWGRNVKSANVKIAVVNQDTGSAGGTNYASQLAELLDSDDYEVVNYETAKEGLKNKSYGAAVILPSDMSSRVATISANSTEQVVLDYNMADDLNEKEYVDAFEKVYELQLLFNNRLTKAFMNSIFDEVRTGQGNVAAVNDLNDTDLSSANALAMTRFTDEIDWTDIPRVDLDIKKLNLDEYKLVNKNSEFANEVRKLFSDGYSQAYTDNESNIIAAMNKIDADYAGVKSFADDMNADKGSLTDYKNNISNWMDNFKKNIPLPASINIPNKVAAENLVPTDLQDSSQLMQEVSAGLKPYDEGVADGTYTDMTDFYNKVMAYKNTIENYKNAVDTYKDNVDRKANELNDNNRELTQAKDALASYKDNLGNYIDTQKTAFDNINLGALNLEINAGRYQGIADDIKTNKEAFKDRIKLISPTEVNGTVMTKYSAGDKTLQELLDSDVNSFDRELRMMNDNVNAMQTDNMAQLNDIYNLYNKHVVDVHTKAVTGYSAASENLAAAVKIFNEVANVNAAKTKTYLSNISGLLNYGEEGNKTNSSVISFIAQPLVLNEVEL